MPSILVIDDDPNVRDILQRMLGRAGYDVTTAINGKEGIRLFRAEGADVVITDIVMPEKEGLETIRELLEEFPDIKIIVMSGGGGLGEPSSYLSIAKMLGARLSFRKPIPRAELLAAVNEPSRSRRSLNVAGGDLPRSAQITTESRPGWKALSAVFHLGRD